ncbi:MAG: hypothetical protein AVDCRST_MAG54-1709, partial [uncultured Actinomycetospora sp.]
AKQSSPGPVAVALVRLRRRPARALRAVGAARHHLPHVVAAPPPAGDRADRAVLDRDHRVRARTAVAAPDVCPRRGDHGPDLLGGLPARDRRAPPGQGGLPAGHRARDPRGAHRGQGRGGRRAVRDAISDTPGVL